MDKKTLIIGATTNSDRYAYLAAQALLRKGHPLVLFGIKKGNVFDIPIQNEFPSLEKDVHTVTMYVGPDKQQPYYDLIVKLKPQRVIFNPGTENPEFFKILEENKIEVEIACTLVMLSNNLY